MSGNASQARLNWYTSDYYLGDIYISSDQFAYSMEITPFFFLPDKEITFNFIRSSGPGGQNVNKVASAVQLRFEVHKSPSLSVEVKNRLALLAGEKITREGTLIIEAKRFRSQERNRLDAEFRLRTLIQKALVEPKKRMPTKPSAAAQARRVVTKKKRAGLKRLRKIIRDDLIS
jgi:ribosome-associated protein